MKTFIRRSISGVAYAAIIIGSIFSGPLIFGLVMFVVLLLSIFEFHKILEKIGNPPSRPLFILSSALIYLTVFMVILSVLPARWLGATLLIFFLSVLFQFFQNGEHAIEKTGMLLLGFSYLTLPLLILNLFYFGNFKFEDPDIMILLGLFIITWVNDTFAYITGSLIGKHKLAARISPKKTWEGSLGGFVLSMAAGYALSLVFLQMETVHWIIFSAIVVASGTVGDLAESVLKRNAGIKESGNLIPGHGGILDRIDSILVSAPVVFIYVYFILNQYEV